MKQTTKGVSTNFPDELFDTRRRNTLERLKVRANRESKAVEVSVNGVLS